MPGVGCMPAGPGVIMLRFRKPPGLTGLEVPGARPVRDRISIRLYHLGDPFDPTSVPQPRLDGSQESGFGVYLITQSVDVVRYYRDEQGRSCIALTKNR